MLSTSRISAAALAMTAALALAGCNSSSTPAANASTANISGDYAGTMQDAQSGNGTVTATLAQHGSNAGGTIDDTISGGTLTAQISLSIAPSNAVTGTMVIDYPPAGTGPVCTFKTTGTYANNGSSATLSGTYTAVTNCSGDSGSYTLTQQCTDTVASEQRRVMTFPAKC